MGLIPFPRQAGEWTDEAKERFFGAKNEEVPSIPGPPRTYFLGTGALKGPLRAYYSGTLRGREWCLE